jgi:hypothetical protein
MTEDRGTDYAPNDIREEVIQKIQTIVGTRLTAFDVVYPSLGLTVTFDNGSQLIILPAPEDDEWELSYWNYSPLTACLRLALVRFGRL